MAKPTGVSAAEAAAAAAAADELLTDGIVSQNNKTALGCKRQQILRPARTTFNTLCHCPAYLSPTPSPTHPPVYLATPVLTDYVMTEHLASGTTSLSRRGRRPTGNGGNGRHGVLAKQA